MASKHWPAWRQKKHYKKKASYGRSAKSTPTVNNQRPSPLPEAKSAKAVRRFRSRRSTEPTYRPREPVNGLKKNNPLRGIPGPFGIPHDRPGHRAFVPNIFPRMMNFPVPGVSPYIAYGHGARMPEYLALGTASIRRPSGIYGLPPINPLFNRG